MQKWEYRIVWRRVASIEGTELYDTDKKDPVSKLPGAPVSPEYKAAIVRHLNDLGEEGWELVAGSFDPLEGLYLKRPKP